MRSATFVLACALAAVPGGAAAQEGMPLALISARVSLDGTSNIHAFTASTAMVQMMALDVDTGQGGDLLDRALQPGGLKRFEVLMPAVSLTSPKDGIDKNMHKALKVQEHPNIRFRLRSLEPTADGGYRALGSLTIAGVEKETALALKVERKGAALAITGGTELLMTDFGVTPPKAMLGMLKTNPKVQIRFELLLGTLSS